MAHSATPVPKHIRTTMEDAHAAGWEVQQRPKSVLFIPLQGKKVTVPLTNPPTAAQLKANMAKAGLYSWAKNQDSEPELPAAKVAEQAEPPQEEHTHEQEDTTTSSEPKAGSTSALFPCPECGHASKGGQGLAAHRRARHGITNTTTKTDRISATGLPQNVVEATQALLNHISAELTRGDDNKDQHASRTAELEAENQRLTKTVSELRARLSDRPTRSKADRQAEEISSLKTENRKLVRFRDKVEAECRNQNQAPVQAIVNIIKHGGHGFALPGNS